MHFLASLYRHQTNQALEEVRGRDSTFTVGHALLNVVPFDRGKRLFSIRNSENLTLPTLTLSSLTWPNLISAGSSPGNGGKRLNRICSWGRKNAGSLESCWILDKLTPGQRDCQPSGETQTIGAYLLKKPESWAFLVTFFGTIVCIKEGKERLSIVINYNLT